MSENKVITLPSSEEIMARLKKIDMGANEYMAEKFFPLIAAEGGHELVAQGIVLMLTFKIYDFVHLGYPPIMEGILHRFVPEIIDILVDDREVAETAKRLHRKAMDSV